MCSVKRMGKTIIVLVLLASAACGPSLPVEVEPDAMEVDASLDNAIVEGTWSIVMNIDTESCTLTWTTWTVPTFDIEVESDGDVIVGSADSDVQTISASVESLQSLHVEISQRYSGEFMATVTIDAEDDGSVAHATAHLVTASGSCDVVDPNALVERARE